MSRRARRRLAEARWATGGGGGGLRALLVPGPSSSHRPAGRSRSWVFSCGIPHQPGIEGGGGEHGDDDDGGEGYGPDTGLDGGDRAKLNETGEDREHEDVDHRPAPDRLDDSIKERTIAQPPSAAAAGGDPQEHHTPDLQDPPP